jgi:chloramphenicol-sensitive protein RarD
VKRVATTVDGVMTTPRAIHSETADPADALVAAGATEGSLPKPTSIAGLLAGAGAYLIWGLFPLYFRELHSISALEIAGIRILATAVVAWAVLAIRGDLAWVGSIPSNRMRLRILLAGLAIATNWLIYVWAVGHGHVIDSAIGYYINPLITVAVGVIVLRERLSRLQKIALAFGAGSVGVLTFAYGKVPWIALGLATSFALYAYLKKTTGLQSLQSLAAETTALTPFAIIGLALMARASGGLGTTHATTKTTMFLLFIGVVTAIPLTLFGIAARKIPLAQIGLLQYIAPTMVLFCGVVFLHEKVSNPRWIGMAFVWVALVLLAVDAAKNAKSK